MNEQRIGEQFNTADQANQINKEMNIPAANPDPFVDKAPVYVPLAGVPPMYETPLHEVEETVPMDTTAVDSGPIYVPLAGTPPMYETPLYEVKETAAVNDNPMRAPSVVMDEMDAAAADTHRMDLPLADVPPMYDGTPVQEMPMKEPEVVVGPMGAMITREAPASLNFGSLAALINREESEHFRTRWNEIQNKFVDEPRSAVQQADALVSEVIEQITRMFADEHGTLEGQWKQGGEVSTEDLRKALQRYRSFFTRSGV